MSEDKSLVRYIIGASRIKYEVLDRIFLEHPDLKGVNIKNKYDMSVMLVDAYSILYRLYTQGDISSVYADTTDELIVDLTVGFLNVLGHFRRYMSTRLHLDNDIICTFNMTSCKYQESLVSGYNNNHLMKLSVDNPTFGFINRALRKAWEFIISISTYFHGIYCVDMQGVDDVAALHTLVPINDENLYLVVSRNPVAMQFLAYGQDKSTPNWYQIFPKRDNSICVNANDCIRRAYLKDSTLRPNKRLGPKDLPYMWTLGGCHYVSMGPSHFARGASTAARIANRLMEQTSMTPAEYSFEQFCSAITPFLKKGELWLKSEEKNLRKRFAATALPLMMRAVTKDQALNARVNMIDQFNQPKLEELNEMLVSMSNSDEPMIMELDNLNMSEAN